MQNKVWEEKRKPISTEIWLQKSLNKDYYKRKQNLVAKNQIARETPVNELIKPVNLVEKFTANNAGERKYENKYGEGVRGEIQNSVADLKDEPKLN